MTYFETPTAQAAYYAGMSEDAYLAREDAIAEDLDALRRAGQPHLDPEDRDVLDYFDVLDPDEGIVRSYGEGHARYFPGASGE